jgi:hypothetical protein
MAPSELHDRGPAAGAVVRRICGRVSRSARSTVESDVWRAPHPLRIPAISGLPPGSSLEDTAGSFALLATPRFPAGNEHGSHLDAGDRQALTLWHVTVIQR